MTYGELVAWIDEGLAKSRAQFEQSVIEYIDDVADLDALLEDNAQRLLAWRRETLANIRAQLKREFE